MRFTPRTVDLTARGGLALDKPLRTRSLHLKLLQIWHCKPLHIRGLRQARQGRARLRMTLEPLLGSAALYRADVSWNTSSELSRHMWSSTASWATRWILIRYKPLHTWSSLKSGIESPFTCGPRQLQAPSHVVLHSFVGHAVDSDQVLPETLLLSRLGLKVRV